MKIEELVALIEETANGVENWYNSVKDAAGNKPSDIAKAYWHIKTNHEELDKQRKRIYHVMDALDKYLLPKIMEENGMDMLRIPELGRSFSVRNVLSASMIDREAGIEWLRDNGHGDIVQETVNAGTLASFMRNLVLEEGIDPPEEIFKISTYNKTNTTKYTPK